MPGELAQNYCSKDRNLFDAMEYTSSTTSDNKNSVIQNENNNSGHKPAEGETSSTSSSANRISPANSTPAPNSGVEVSEFNSVEDISISKINSQTKARENINSNAELTVLNDIAIQTDCPQITVPFPQRNKREREYATAKPSKFRKIDSYFRNMSSFELNQQKSLEDSFLNL